MEYFPVFLKLTGQPVLVLGGGSVAERKIRLLLSAGAKVSVVARELNAACQQWLRDGDIDHVAKSYRAEQVTGHRLIFAASDDRALNHQVYRDAEAAGIAVNVVDEPEFCRFISPALINRAPVQIAISTGGTAPALARRLRSLLEAQLPDGLGRMAAAAGQVRKKVRGLLPASRRRAFWDQQFELNNVQACNTQTQAVLTENMLAAARADARAAATQACGKVYLVGGGPGRPDLLTIRALQVLGQADVILHDRLVPEPVIDLARRDAVRIDVGKRAGAQQTPQADIHQLLLQYTRQGKSVVRLKGGDPFIFGRGGEELEWLHAHGIDYEVVPGITAASACSAFAGIPLTHRRHASVVSFITGHAASAEPLDWAALAGTGKTLAVYMGLQQAAIIRSQLLAAGVDPGLPAALITGGTTGQQQTIIATIDELPGMASRNQNGAPGLFIIGQVAALGSTLAWFNTPAILAAAA